MTLTTINLAALGDTINLGTEVTGTLPTGNGGTGSTATTFVNAASNVTGTLPVPNGGTGLASGTTDQFLKFTGSTTVASAAVSAGITESDMWRVTADFSGSANPIASNLERVDDASFGKLGTGMTNSSGTFSFPTTGIYLVRFVAFQYTDNAADYVSIKINVTINNSSYDTYSQGIAQMYPVDAFSQGQSSAMIDVTDVSNVKVRFEIDQADTGNVIRGNSDYNRTWFEFTRLGDT